MWLVGWCGRGFVVVPLPAFRAKGNFCMAEAIENETPEMETKESGGGESFEFTPPEGFTAPDGSEGGKPFDLVCTFEPCEGGKLRLVKLGDVEMPAGDYAKEESGRGRYRPSYGRYSRGMMDEMTPAAGEGASGMMT